MTKRLLIYAFTGILTLTAAISAGAGDWPGWRGPDGTGISPDKQLPMQWSPTRNVRWRVPLPGPGNSSPIVWGDRVFVTQAVKGESRRTVMCFDRKDGKLLWQSGTIYTEKEKTHPTNPFCAASPVTDGERVIASFGSAGLYCYDFAGKELWHRDFGKMDHVFGNASSPALVGELCIFYFGPDAKARLIAVNKQTGETAWEIPPPKVDPSEQAPPPTSGDQGAQSRPRSSVIPGTWATPFLIDAGDREELIVNFSNRLCGYDPKTGKQFWRSKGISKYIFMTPIWGEGILVAQSSGLEGGRVIAVKPGGRGDVSESRNVWRRNPDKSRIGSGVIHAGYCFLITDPGVMTCVDIKTGKTVWEESLKGSGAKKSTWSSMLLAEGKIYLPNQAGDVFVLRAGPRFELLATNSIGEPTNASLAASNGEFFMRTDKALWCFAAAKP